MASGSDKEDVAVTVELETPFLLVVHPVKANEVGEWGERARGRERKRRQGGVVSRARLSRGYPGAR